MTTCSDACVKGLRPMLRWSPTDGCICGPETWGSSTRIDPVPASAAPAPPPTPSASAAPAGSAK
jgi:hypothetical protein